MDNFKRFSKKIFYSFLKHGTTGDNDEKLDGHISYKYYLTCNKIWKEFNMKNMGDYYDQYLEKIYCCWLMFIDTCLKLYKLDPCHYFNSPELSWDAMLKMTSVKLQKILDIDMYLFI